MSRNPIVQQLGERIDHEIRQGSTFGPMRHTLTNPDDSPMDLTGYQFRGTVRHTPGAYGVPLASFVMTLADDPTEGYYDMSIPAAVMAAIPVPADKPFLRCYYDTEMVDTLDQVRPVFYGEFLVYAEATRPDVDEPVVTTPTCC